ncbi:MAG: dUTP diphosphatase [Coriobacteriales bacterium]|jgi:dUTP pyrophosphatase
MAKHIELKIKKLDAGLSLPRYANPGDAGLDLYSTIDIKLAPGERGMIPTGIAVAIPSGYAGFVQPRSGLAARQGFSIVNTPGLIDSGYRGEIKVIGINTDKDAAIEVKRGDRIAQLVIQETPVVEILEVDELDETDRSAGGFGSTGK